mmetsp:Transcript_21671/g.41376  ORF Transcript_21671/g.41376 Transcript_21671/m.41376 type:complete len:182 (-) Transcript_21671:341-886(-)
MPGYGEVESRQHVPQQEFKENLKLIINHIRSARLDWNNDAPRILLITPPPVDAEAWQTHRLKTFDPPPEAHTNARCNDYTKQYAAAVMEVAKETSTPAVDLFSAFISISNWQKCMCDGLHFSPKGNRMVLNAINEAIQCHFPNFMPESLEIDFPLHKDIDPLFPSSTIARHLEHKSVPNSS